MKIKNVFDYSIYITTKFTFFQDWYTVMEGVTMML